MTQPKAKFSEIGAAIHRGITHLEAHPSVTQILGVQLDPNRGYVEVTASIQLGLPNQWMAAGVSPNGVNAVETVTFLFPQNFPTHAPTVILRNNFDRSLAHVQPGSLDEPVSPCLFDGDLNELLHEQGLSAIVNQLIGWLEKAALEELINPSQGWEPIRRDSLEGFIVADSAALRKLALIGRKYELLGFIYLKLPKHPSASPALQSLLYYGHIDPRPLRSQDLQSLLDQWETEPQAMAGFSLALIILPTPLPSGQLPIADRYFPETVSDIASLQERAGLYGCDKNLNVALSALEAKLRGRDFDSAKLPIALFLCVRRPFPLIGEDSDIELMPYLIEIGAPKTLSAGAQTPVLPAAHRDALTPKLLQRFSGDPCLENRDVVLVGCGSLGSKIGIHLARSGAAPAIVIDKNFLSPHNAARHALLPTIENPWDFTSKAKALASSIRGLGQKTIVGDQDITEIVDNDKLLRKFFPRNTWAIINATASLTVRETLAAVSPNQLHPRIIEAALFAKGEIGVLTIEGPNRNPNSADLIAETYALMREDTKFRRAVFESETPLRSYGIGQGCGSMTMTISDAKISAMAAAMTLAIAQMRENNLPSSGGKIVLGAITENGMGLKWQSFKTLPVKIIAIEKAPLWTVRIIDRAHQKIMQDCAKYPNLETGGIIVGRVFESLRAFVVTDVLPAPIDSERSKSQFVLGISDVTAMLAQYSAACNQALYCLGTWHSHLNDSGPSDLDWQTAQRLSKVQDTPSVLLIRTPNSYRAIASI
jgi:hypothetical protein